jgi:hypothetical protein
LVGSDSGSIVEELEVVVCKKGFYGVRKERRGDSVDNWNYLADEVRGHERGDREVKGRDTTETRIPKESGSGLLRGPGPVATTKLKVFIIDSRTVTTPEDPQSRSSAAFVLYSLRRGQSMA